MAGRAHTLSCLARMARAKAERWEAKAAMAVDASSSHGQQASLPRPQARSHQRGGPSNGWKAWSDGSRAHSGSRSKTTNDEIPDELEIDDAEGCDFTQSSTDCAAPIWQDGSATCDTPLCDQADVEAEADSWANVWQEGREYLWQHDQDRPARLTPPELRATARTFLRDAGVGGDYVAPKAVERLSDEVLARLCDLLYAFEERGQWPARFQLVLAVLLPKADGGRRPIGLFSTIVRVWMRARAHYARAWEAAHDKQCMYGGAGKGAQRAAGQAAFAPRQPPCATGTTGRRSWTW